MSRPIKDGVPYWPFDVDLFDDKKFKLIRAEFGIKGAYIALVILNSVYKENGYFKRWDDDDCCLMSEGVGDGCTPQLVDEVLAGCVRRGLFDHALFQTFGILTSTGIQRRFFNIVKRSRNKIVVIKEYLLFDLNDQTLAEGVLNKVILKTVSQLENLDKLAGNPDKLAGNPDKLAGNPLKEKKQKEIKRNEMIHSSACASARVDYKAVMESFNSICTDLPNVRDLTDARRSSIRKAAERLAEDGGFEAFFERVHGSDFLCGRSGKWKCGFDWILKPANMTKIREGNYDNRSTVVVDNSSDEDDEYEEMVARYIPVYKKTKGS